NEDHLGVRAKVDIQCSRLKVSFFTINDLVKTPFLSLDYARVFISPVLSEMQSEVSAEVEMEAEWVEVKWAPEALHAIGGALELGIFTLASFLHESRYPAKENIDTSTDHYGWNTNSRLTVPPMREMVEVAQDNTSPDEIIVFRCVAKRICVMFPYIYDGQRHVDCVAVDTFAVSSEETTGRLRISILDARAFPSRRMSGTDSDHDPAFFVADCFSLEENQVVGSVKTVVDLFVNGVRLEWDISTQLRIMELVRRITFSSWEMIYRARSTYAIHCTPRDSIYNRAHGLNPPLEDIDECLRYENLFDGLISASGDKLHRLHATNLVVNAKLCDEVDVHLTVGVFAGNDLPEVWLFENIIMKVNELDIAVVGAVRVRHTINKQAKYVYGEFEDMLRKRLSACKRSSMALDQTLTDGILVDITKLHLCTTKDFPIQSYADIICKSFDPFKEKLAWAASSYWRPQQELFYQFFLRTPVASHQMDLWLSLEDITYVSRCLGNPLESWMERMYPVWMEELIEQELRSHMLDDHISTLKLTNADLLSDDSHKELKTLLAEKNSRLYIQKVKRLTHETSDGDSGALISVGIGHVAVDVSFEEDITTSWDTIKELDEATEALENASNAVGHDLMLFTPTCPLFVGIQVKTSVVDLAVEMRRFPTPLMTCNRLNVEGHVFLTAFSSGSDDMPFDIMAAARCFVNLSIDVISPVLYFNPGYVYALHELSELALGFIPLAILEVDKRYQTSIVDIVRRLLHGKISVNVKDAGVRLIRGATSYESTDFLEVAVHRVQVVYSSGLIDIEVTRVAAKIDPGALSHIAELSHLKLQVWLKWGCLGDAAMHHTYPIEFIGLENTNVAGKKFLLQTPDHADLSSSPGTNPFEAFQANKLFVYINGRICPENGDPNSSDGWSKRDMASRTAVVLYSRSVEWLIEFGRAYRKIPRYPLPRHRDTGQKLTLPSIDILSILQGVTIEEFDLIGLDVALYASEKHPVGVRAFIDDKISCSGALLKSSHGAFVGAETKVVDANEVSTSVRRLSFIIEDSTWILHDVNVDARDIQVRVCTPMSGSRGEPLVSVKHVALIVGGGTERVPTHDNGLMKLHSPPPMKRITNAQPFNFLQSPSGEGAKERSKQSILEFFHIPHENPFSYRESDSESEGEVDECEAGGVAKENEPSQSEVLDEFRRAGYLLGLFSKEVRVTVTMMALESLVDIADTWVQVVVTSIPELFRDAAEIAVLLEKNDDDKGEPDIIVDETGRSPKKFTSLAQDPKFSGICLQGGADAPVSPNNRQEFEPTPYSNADTVRPVKRNSSKVPSQLERLRTTEDITLPPPTNSKLVQAFMMVKFEDCQISVQDQLHKGSVLLALNAGTLQHAASSDSSHERIDLNVDGFQVFTARLDVDVKSHAVWLKALSDGSYCPRSYGLLRQVIAPIPAQVTIWTDHEKAIVKNRVKLDIPVIEVQVNLASKGILEKLITTATELTNSKLAEKKSQDHSHLFHSYVKGGKHQKRSLRQLVALKKQLKWKIATLEWRQMTGWEYRMNDRAMAVFSSTENTRSLAFEIETPSQFPRRKLSSTSVSSVTTSMSMMGSAVTNRYEDDHFSDELERMTQQYDALSELTRFMATEIQKQTKPSPPSPNVDMEFALDRASLTLSGENVDIVRAQVGSLCFSMQLFEDHSGKFALTLQDLSVSNLSPGTPYPDMLQPVYSRSWEGDDMFLRIDAEIAKPIGRTTVVQHFEVNVHPIQVCITQEVIMQLVTFFSPPKTTNTKEVQREEVRSQFLQARTSSSSSSDGRVGSAIMKAVKVAGKAAAHPLSIGRTHRSDSDEDSSSGKKGKGGGLQLIHEDPSQWIAKLAESNELQFNGLSDEAEQRSDSSDRGINEMKDGAKNNILFKRIRLGAIEIVLTYKNKKSSVSNSTPINLHSSQPQALEDMRGFEVKTRALVYCDKTCSPLDLVLRIRRDILLDVLSQVGRNFTNIGNFLRDQFDTSRWAAFDALAPLKSLSTTVTSLTAHGAVLPLSGSTETSRTSSSVSDSKVKESEEPSKTSTATSLRSSELPRRNSDLLSDQDEDSPTAGSHPKQVKAKRSLKKLFTRRKSSSSPLQSPTTKN
ncbi:putative membrane protein, partial [Phytophthora megakarya]